ncbi:hypothetical protein KC678_01940 [Candidatus Dojkabacteria bacterium]|uniref:5-formyltetrahydrofolate cyclo-ligase n=1 Tax=Candidatus Dojkabacteria bacterium TaxID=2099670 RepID=A0A955I8R1_9BACT|nr:hypothetical protein [Candidatus Dojkabacteria bacterium]
MYTKPNLRDYFKKLQFQTKYNLDTLLGKIYSQCFDSGTQVFIYQSLKNEVPTKEIINYFIQNNIQVFVPDKKAVDVKPLNQVNPIPDYENMLAIVPGLAFTKDGKRLGRGGGWYDKFFAMHKVKRKIGLCFKEQILKDLPIEEYDVFMDEVITV